MATQYTAKEYKHYLDKTVRGQEAAKRAASVLLYNHRRGIKQNAIFVGPSGCGKTQIFRSLRDLDPCIYIYDVSGMSQKGYTGDKKADSIFQQMLADGLNKSQIEHALIVFDEFDKVCIPEIGSGGTNHTYNLQAEFLAMVEGTKLSVKTAGADMAYERITTIDTSHITFAFLGAFEGLYEARDEAKSFGFNSDEEQQNIDNAKALEIQQQELIKYGLRPELAGRVGMIVTLNKLSEQDYEYILKTPTMSPIAKIAQQYQVNIQVSQPFLKETIKQACQVPTGVRGVQTAIQSKVNDEIYEPGSTHGQVILEELIAPIISKSEFLEQKDNTTSEDAFNLFN